MKVYIEEDELWPVYTLIREEAATEFDKKYAALIDIPDHIHVAYLEAYAEYLEARAIIHELIEEFEEK